MAVAPSGKRRKNVAERYVLQNIIASAVFYGWGLGLAGKLNSAAIIAVWSLISALQLGMASCGFAASSWGPWRPSANRQ